jgi:hypothetical protein
MKKAATSMPISRVSGTLHPTPYTLHPTPYTLHPLPSTLTPRPTPSTFEVRGGRERDVRGQELADRKQESRAGLQDLSTPDSRKVSPKVNFP